MNKLRMYILLFFSSNYCATIAFGQFRQLKFEHITSEDGLPHSTIHGIAKDKYGFMWFGTWSGLCRYDGYKFKVYRYDANDPKSIVNNRIHNILMDDSGNMWILTFDDKFVCRYNYLADDFDRIPQSHAPTGLLPLISRRNHLLNIQFNYKQSNWHLDTYINSVVETHIPSGKTKVYGPNPIDAWSINDSYVSDIYLDDQHILWLGTYSNGINKAQLESSPFHYWYHDPTNRNSIVDKTIRSICEDLADNIWIGTRNKGITVIKKDGQYQHFQHEENNRGSLGSNYVKKVFCDSKGLIWIGHQKGLDSFDPASGKITRLQIPSIENTTVFDIIEDQHTNLWLASWKGVLKYDRLQKKVIHFTPSAIMPTRFVWTIFVDSKQQIWAGTEGDGIMVLKEKKNGSLQRIFHLKHDNTDSHSLSDNRIYSIYEDRNNRIWIGTGNGLDRYDPITKMITHFSGIPQGLPGGAIAGITADNEGHIWASHKRGISKIDLKTNHAIRNFSRQNGLQSNEFSDGAVYKSKTKNLLYFGSNNGVNAFCPDSIKMDNMPPRVVLTELQVLNETVAVNDSVNGRILLHQPLYLSKSLNLVYEDKSIAIEFAALHYTNPDGNKYAYMLEGFDKDWIYTDATQRTATYSNLSPGEFTFKVKASNSDGTWNASPTTLPISVAPAWWASTSAYVVYTLFLISLLLALYYYLIRYARLKSKLAYEALLHEKEHELHESKVQFFTNISHEIKTPLTLILSPIQQMQDWHKDDERTDSLLKTMENNGKRLLKTVNQLLDIRRFETGHEKLHVEKTDLVTLIHKILDSFAIEARQKKIRLKIASSNPAILAEVDPDKIEKVLYNLLSNALKFTDSGGIVKVRIRQKAWNLEINVIDNGSGIPAEDLDRVFKPFLQGKTTTPGGSGLGLTYSKLLVELHNGTLTVQSRTNTQQLHLTIFRILLPIENTTARSTIQTDQDEPASPVMDDLLALQPTLSAESKKTWPRKCTLLLVEDNEEMRKYLTDFFRKDYEIIEASDGQIGIQLAKEHTPDLIISDVMMPNVDGISFTHQVKSDVLLCHIPIILLTARTLVEYEVGGLETGADDYMVKPFHLPVLALKVRNQLLGLFRMKEKFRQKISIEPSEIDVQSPDELLLQKVLKYVEENISDSDLNIDKVCQSIGLSRAQLYRKMKALTGFSMADIIREIRLKRAQQLLRDKKFNISEISYMVGFSDAEYFRKCFKAKFGQSPSEYVKEHKKT